MDNGNPGEGEEEGGGVMESGKTGRRRKKV
jgi:hypothetical protein